MTTDQDAHVDKVAAGEPSDHSLLRRFRWGSQDAATQLYSRYAQRLRALAEARWSTDLTPRVDVDDIVQSVFGSFFRRASQGYYDVPAGEELWGLLMVMALNKIRAKGAFHRAARRDVRRTIGGEEVEQVVETSGARDESACSCSHLAIDDALARLPAEHQAMVELRIQGFEVAEIARKTSRSKRSVERILQEARRQLGVLLNEEDQHVAGNGAAAHRGAR
jgi:RNA polymerase sigma-70 factor (ECF subfamily)